jgi:fimbrial isopeptide formation D2 family protein
MRKNRILAAALTLILTFALTAPSGVFAAEPLGSITINAPASGSVSIEGQTFDIYRIFDLTMSDIDNPDDSAYSYTTATKFTNFESGYSEKGAMTLSEYVATLTDPADIEAFAAAVWAWINNNSIQPDRTSDAVADEATSVTIDNLSLGYYLVYGEGITDNEETVVAACSLTSANPIANITIKADVPMISKGVSDAADGTSGEHTDLNIGDTAYFTLTTAIPDMRGYAAYTFIVHDTLSDGLDFNGITDGNNAGNGVVVEIGSYTYATGYTVAVSGQELTITFTGLPSAFQNYTIGDPIVITYSAILNEDAVIAASSNYDGEFNSAYITYSNTPYADSTGETLHDVVNVYTFKFDIYKHAGIANGAGDEPLSDAIFNLHTGTDSGALKQFSYDGVAGVYKVVASGGDGDLTSGTDGMIHIEGLDEGTYFLEEITAPDGYNLLADPIKIIITPTYTAGGVLDTYSVTYYVDDEDVSGTVAAGNKINVQNNTGTLFPESGGMGRTIFTISGLILMLGAALVLIARRKTAQR